MATLIARIQTIGMEHYFAIALDSGGTLRSFRTS